MKVSLIVVGQTDQKEIENIINQYVDKIKRYCEFNIIMIKDLKKGAKISELELKRMEGKLILEHIQKNDIAFLLDDKGKEYTSKEFAEVFLQKQMNAGIKNLVFIIGGAYGFDESVVAFSKGKISLSKMTFTHQMARIIFLEQLYRGYSILKGEKYHHE